MARPKPKPIYEPSGLLAGRLTDTQRGEMRAYFWAVSAQAFRNECLIYLSREMLLTRPRHRDWQGIQDLLDIAKSRGLVNQWESAADNVDDWLKQGTDPPPDANERPPWEQAGSGRWGGKTGRKIPAHFAKPKRSSNSGSFGSRGEGSKKRKTNEWEEGGD